MLHIEFLLSSLALSEERADLADLGRQGERPAERHLVAQVRELDLGAEVETLDGPGVAQVERQGAAVHVVALERGVSEGGDLRNERVGADEACQCVAELKAILAEPSLYQEAILLLSRRGLDVGEAAKRAASAEPHVECEVLISAWAEVYRDPAHHWDLYELAEKLIDFEDYLRRWRFNHVTTVERIIGLKRGTGGTSGVGYLKRMLEIELFPELWRVRTRM